MKYHSTNNRQRTVSLKEAVLQGLPDDNGLFMPERFPAFKDSFFKELSLLSFKELSLVIADRFLAEDVPLQALEDIIDQAINFSCPLISLDEQTYILELFHGPTMAFKDVGARFMARLMQYFLKDEDEVTTILVATSGDTGGAVASAFAGMKGIEVVILYPGGKVSPLQERQLTTWGGNVSALKVDGSFDDCQRMVKEAFLDKTLSKRLSSANSINIARLIPQTFYYFEAWKKLENKDRVVFVVPSGNLGDLTAGVFAKRLGLPVEAFFAATNANDEFPTFLQTGIYTPKPSVQTLSTAMDVGSPSNFYRLMSMYSSTWNFMNREIQGYAVDDLTTIASIVEVNDRFKYLIDPHGAVGYNAWQELKVEGQQGIILETAHYSKFEEVMKEALGKPIELAPRLLAFMNKPMSSTPISANYTDLKDYLSR